MTEVEWLTSMVPDPMIEMIQGTWKHSFFEFGKWVGIRRQNNTERKLRLFACACMRHVWERLDERDKWATEVAERYIVGRATMSEMDAAATRCGVPGVSGVTLKWASDAVRSAVGTVVGELASHDLDDPRRQPVLSHLSSLFRCVMGNPFRPVSADPRWFTSTVVALAEGIYQERAFDRMPILADALEDAGCDHADVLTHCRQPGEHVRGCWVVDLLTGRK